MLRFNNVKDYAAKFGAVLEKRVDDGRIYADRRQCEADTGRMSCANPNLQGLPKKGELRGAIAASEGFSLIVSDLSQIEIRALAALSEDETLISASEVGADIHRSVAATVLGKPEGEATNEERIIAKSIVFGMMYGQGVSSLKNTIENRLDREFPESEAHRYWSRFFDAYPEVRRWRDAESASPDNS